MSPRTVSSASSSCGSVPSYLVSFPPEILPRRPSPIDYRSTEHRLDQKDSSLAAIQSARACYNCRCSFAFSVLMIATVLARCSLFSAVID